MGCLQQVFEVRLLDGGRVTVSFGSAGSMLDLDNAVVPINAILQPQSTVMELLDACRRRVRLKLIDTDLVLKTCQPEEYRQSWADA